jgi:hypothetical protein
MDGSSQLDSESLKPLLDQLDDECYLVVVPGCSYPLNLPPELQQQEFVDQIQEDGTILPAQDQMFAAIQEAVRWPIPFWLDGGWPCELLSFHEKPGQVWPISHLKPGIGHLQFLNWAMSFLAERVMTSSTTFVGQLDALHEDITKAFQKNEAGFAHLRIKNLHGAKSVNDLITFLNPPEVNMNLWQMIEAVNTDFEKAVGLNELIYGIQDTQSRSATDVNIRQANSNVRIEDMRRKVEKFSERIARKEAIAARWMLTSADVAPIVGQMRSQLADSLLFNQPLDQVAREFSYEIAPGDGATRNKLLAQQNIQGALQNFGPVYAGLLQMGNVAPWNSLVQMFGDAFDLNVQGLLVAPPPPMLPMPPPESQGEPPPAEAA